jgi:8-oxo-dGTP pyrophosphatase MutT (NUDIX family)
MLTQIRNRLKGYRARTLKSPRAICAGVIVPVFEREKELFVILTKRTQTVRAHKGEVSFPGGMCEERDASTLNTALRECCEEIGVLGKDVDVIGRLDDMITLTGFVITPYVGVIPYPYEFKTNPEEVAYLIYFPMESLIEAVPEYDKAKLDNHVIRVPSIYYQGDRIWGATCRILLQFRQIIQ